MKRAKTLAMILSSVPCGTPNGPEGWIAWQKIKERWLNRKNSRKP